MLLKVFLSILLLTFSFSALSQKATASAQQVITIRLMDITILEKTPSAVRAGDLEKTPVKVQSAQKWVINTSFINDREKHDVFEKITEFIEYSNRLIGMDIKVVTLTNI